MTTEQEFQKAIEMLINCKATLECGCEYEIEKAEYLNYLCKRYIETYKKVVE